METVTTAIKFRVPSYIFHFMLTHAHCQNHFGLIYIGCLKCHLEH